jgi:ATP-binding cassette subfamily B protein
MISINAELTMWVLIPLPIMSVLVYKVSSTMNRQSERVQHEQSNLSSTVQESFSGIRVLKAYGAEGAFKKKFNSSTDNYLKRNMDLVVTNSLFMPTIILLIGLSTVLVVYIGGLMAMDPKQGIDVGEIVQFIMYVNMLTWPFASVGWVTSLVQRAAASQERINEFLNEKPDIVNPSSEKNDLKGEVKFENVTYTYPNSGIQAIKDLSFKIDAGKTLAILGRTGSGKSSIINLVMRQFDPDSGAVFIDGVNLKELNLDQYRKSTGVVPQEVFLFSDTIANNIKFGLNDTNETSLDEIEAVAKRAHVHLNIFEIMHSRTFDMYVFFFHFAYCFNLPQFDFDTLYYTITLWF